MSNFYRVVIKGTQGGRTDDEVIANLAPIFKMTAEQVRPRFVTRNFVVKRSVDLATAEKYHAFLEQYGCICAIEPESGTTSTPASSVATQTVPAPAEVKPLQLQTSAITPASAILSPAPASAMKARLAVSNTFQGPKKSRSFNGRFDMRQPLNKGAKKRYRLYGKGAITFGSEGIHIVGKRHRPLWFGIATDIVIDYADILDANVDGKILRFNVDGLGKERQDICYIATRVDEAAEMLGLLPTRQSEGAKTKGWLSKIESRDDALKVVKDTSMGFFFIAALQVGLSFIMGFSILLDAIIYAVGGFFLRRFGSRAAAVVLLLLATAEAGVTFANRVGANLGGGNNIFLALIILLAAIRAVDATFKLHGRFSSDAVAVGAPPASSTLDVKGGRVKLLILIVSSLVLSGIVSFQMMGMVTHLPDGSRLLLFAKEIGSVVFAIGVLASLYLIPKANRNIQSFLKAYVMLAAIPALTQCSGWMEKFNGPNKTLLSESTLLAVEVPSDWAITTMNKGKVDLMAMDWAGTAFVSATMADSADRPAEQNDVAAYQLKMNEQLSTALGQQVGQFNCGSLCAGSIYTTTSNGKPMRILSAVKYSEGKLLVIQGGNIAPTNARDSAKVEAAIASARVNVRKQN